MSAHPCICPGCFANAECFYAEKRAQAFAAELSRLESLGPEEMAEEVFASLSEPPGMWRWHVGRSDEWNRAAEARWEALVDGMMQALQCSA